MATAINPSGLTSTRLPLRSNRNPAVRVHTRRHCSRINTARDSATVATVPKPIASSANKIRPPAKSLARTQAAKASNHSRTDRRLGKITRAGCRFAFITGVENSLIASRLQYLCLR